MLQAITWRLEEFPVCQSDGSLFPSTGKKQEIANTVGAPVKIHPDFTRVPRVWILGPRVAILGRSIFLQKSWRFWQPGALLCKKVAEFGIPGHFFAKKSTNLAPRGIFLQNLAVVALTDRLTQGNKIDMATSQKIPPDVNLK